MGIVDTLKKFLLIGDHVCPWWLAYSFDNPVRRLLHDPEIILGGLLRPGQVALDLGCGMGHFTLGLARLVGDTGTVHAVDLQPEMLEIVERRAEKAGLRERIQLHEVAAEQLELECAVDFVLLFWMAHEVQDRVGLFEDLRGLLKEGGKLFLAEPKVHVPKKDFESSLVVAERAGLTPVSRPSVRMSRAVLFEKQAG